MRLKRYVLFSALGITLIALFFTACKKKYPTDTTAAEDDANASIAMHDAKIISDAAIKGQVIAPCATISRRDTNSGTDSLLDINFGSSDCTSAQDKRARRGHILVWYSVGSYYTQGVNINLLFKNYFISEINFNGTAILTNAGKDSAGIHSWSYNADLNLTYENSTASWASQRVCNLVKTGGIFYYAMSGSANGKSRSGATYTSTITSPAYVTVVPYPTGCQYFESGQISFSISTYTYNHSSTYSMNASYGTSVGACGNSAQATIGGDQYPFNQP